jgi:hypothetical protein
VVEQHAQRDRVPVEPGQDAGEVMRERVVDGKPVLLGELQDDGGEERLADAGDAKARVWLSGLRVRRSATPARRR